MAQDEAYTPTVADLRDWLRTLPAERACGVGSNSADCPVARLITARTGRAGTVDYCGSGNRPSTWYYQAGEGPCLPLDPVLMAFARRVDDRHGDGEVFPEGALEDLAAVWDGEAAG